MKKWLPILLMLSIGLIIGCGDDDPEPPTEPGVTVVSVFVDTLIAPTPAPNVDPDHPTWEDIDSTEIEVSMANNPGDAAKVSAVPSVIYLKAVTANDKLFLRIQWADATHDVWPDYFQIDTVKATSLVFSQHRAQEGEEDQLFVMFDGAPGGGWDTWNWRALTTGAVGVAQGLTLRDTVLIPDESEGQAPLTMSFKNWSQGFNQPNYVSKDTSEFTGYKLDFANAVHKDVDLDPGDGTRTPFMTDGWAVGQRIPGRIVRSDEAQRNDAERGSQWDIQAGSDYTDGMYAIVLSRKLTSFPDDLDLAAVTDSVKMQIGVFDNRFSFADVIGTVMSDRGFTKEFWLVFSR